MLLMDRASQGLGVGALLLSLLALCPEAAYGRVRWTTPGAYRLRMVGVSAYPLDSDGTEPGQAVYGVHRLRLDPTIEVGPASVYMQMDVLTGQVFGDIEPTGAEYIQRRAGDPEREFDGWTTVEPQMAWLSLQTNYVDVIAGQMGAQWGMGLLSGDGHDRPAEDERWVERFGDRRAGDIVDRVQLTVRPFSTVTPGPLGDLELSLGGDYVYQDDQASFLDDDSAWQAFGSVLLPGEEMMVGFQILRRWQEDRDGDRLDYYSADLYGAWRLPLYMVGAELLLEGEAVGIIGDTTRFRPSGSPDGVELQQLGWVARGELSWRCPRIALGMEMGYASGDANPDDDEHQQLVFDPDHRVGFILFQDVIRLISLRGAERLADPRRVGVPPAGVEQGPTHGAVTNAIYAQPGLTWRPGPWRLTVAALVAWAAEPFLDPVETSLAGGLARNALGQEAGRFYGTEAMGAVHYRLSLPGIAEAEAGVQAGLLLPGEALNRESPEAISKVVGRLDLRW